MKIKKIENKKKFNLINYNLLNFRLYLGSYNSLYYLNSKYIKGFKNKFSIFEILKIKNYIKKSLSLIYKYHSLNKRILFIGFPFTKKYNNLFYQTKHYFIPKDNWVNNIQNFENLNIKNNNSKIYISKKIPDLIVLYKQIKDKKVFQEIQKIKIPFITFIESQDKSDFLDYKIIGGFQKLNVENFCYLFLKSILTLQKCKNEKKLL